MAIISIINVLCVCVCLFFLFVAPFFAPLCTVWCRTRHYLHPEMRWSTCAVSSQPQQQQQSIVLYTPHSYNASMNCDMKFQINAVLRDDCEHKIMLNSQVIIQMDCFFTVSSLIFIDFILLLISIRVKLRSENELTQVSREDFVIEYWSCNLKWRKHWRRVSRASVDRNVQIS